jgi:cystathionine beta-lyase family protein involved in aluminum resistance
LKTQIFASCLLEKLGYKVTPKYNEKRTDIITVVEFNDEDKLINFCKGLQMGGAIESYVVPVPCDMPGYPNQEIMAGSSFIPGSTIELSADGPLIPPYKVFMQGGITYEYGKLGILIAANNMEK